MENNKQDKNNDICELDKAKWRKNAAKTFLKGIQFLKADVHFNKFNIIDL
jgi:hypothetical protein